MTGVHPILNSILAHKREELRFGKAMVSEEELLFAAERKGQKPRSLYSVLTAPGGKVRIIAEIKRSSPSAMIKPTGFDPARIAQAYETAGACAISVLTDARFFCGAPVYVPMAREAVSLPVLRKDFILDRWQLAETAALGADAVLLMVANFQDVSAFESLYHRALELNLEPLVEIHSEKEWERISHLKPRLVGVNNRDFMSPTLAVDSGTALRIAPLLPDDVAVVSESGISSPEQIRRAMEAGVDGFLIGSHFMKQENPGKALHELISQAG
ncbi:MAG: indole-3-glycerol-phosphate synthase [Nitrospinae bacterium]|nr:indole-3-glycerol-phosphate synthase [Nitrospinota bacterium]